MTDCKHAAAVLLVARHLAAAAQLVERPEWEKRAGQAGRRARPLRRSTSPRSRWSSGSSGFRRSAATSAARTCGSGPARLGKAGTLGPLRDRLGRPRLRGPLLRPRAPRAAAAVPGGGRRRAPGTPCRAVPGCPCARSSSGFWGLLDQAAALGLTVITAKPLLGPIRSDEPATVGLDAARSRGGGLELGPRVELGDRRAGRAAASGCSASRPTGCSGCSPGEDGDRGAVSWPGSSRCIGPELRQLIVEAQRAGRARGGRDAFLGRVRCRGCGRTCRLDLHRRVGAAAGRGRAHAGPDRGLPARPPRTPGLDRAVSRARAELEAYPAGRASGAAQPPRPGRRAGAARRTRAAVRRARRPSWTGREAAAVRRAGACRSSPPAASRSSCWATSSTTGSDRLRPQIAGAP